MYSLFEGLWQAVSAVGLEMKEKMLIVTGKYSEVLSKTLVTGSVISSIALEIK